ncbi:unnamed protein product [Paramecium pentaurelia]|uniref:Uncharacterized protein n=1 Tax=Paramecium pentaurelia TaxID=43138 RepID=A0A8S1TR49_9CILI|nr:unnamed protein product [Paramecium pentaurelia]
MSQDISSSFIQFRRQISSKINNSPLKNQDRYMTPLQKSNNPVGLLKQSITNNLTRLKLKSTICNIGLTPKRNSNIQKLQNSYNKRQSETLKSPKTSLYYSPSNCQQSYLYQLQQPSTYRQNDYLKQQNEIRQYSCKYSKIMNDEQGHYYSQLQAKLDQLSDAIGTKIDRQSNLIEIDNLISLSQKINEKSKVEKYIDILQFESKVLQNDILNIRSKQQRFLNSNEN